MADEMEDRTGEEEAGGCGHPLCSDELRRRRGQQPRYVTLLRQRQEAREEAASAAHAKSKERAKKEKEKD